MPTTTSVPTSALSVTRSKGDSAILSATQSDCLRLTANLHRHPNGCVFWGGSRSKGGYGQIWCKGTTVLAHRLAYFFAHGALPPIGLEIDHTCASWCNPNAILCCAPDHLEPVTGAENKRRQRERNLAFPECRNGHEWMPETTYWHRGQRECAVCKGEATARWHARSMARRKAALGDLDQVP